MASAVKSSLVRFPPCQSVDPSLLPDAMRLAVVFGGGNRVIFITDNDEVFSFGSDNRYGCLGVGDESERTEPTRVEQLCGKEVASIATGGYHVLALTSGGDVYAWGYNVNNELGNGDKSNLLSPQLCRGLQRHKVKQIACGRHHSLALTDTREVLGWGHNVYGQIGTGDTAPATVPLLVHGLPSSPPVEVIRCGCNSSFALTSEGEIHGWGLNNRGQLGIGTKTNELRPQRVGGQLSVKFKDIACGGGLSFAVSDAGDLYVWGYVLESNNVIEILTIKQVDIGGRKVVDIGASLYSRLSSAVTACGRVLVLGMQRGVGITEAPRITLLSTLLDAFVDFSDLRVTCKPLTSTVSSVTEDLTSEEDQFGFIQSLSRHFDNEELSDVKFLVEGKAVYGHVSFLRMRSDYLRTRLSSDWEDTNREIEVKGHSYGAFRSYLKYLYTGRLEVDKEDVLSFLRLTHEYLEEDLRRRCEKLAIKSVTDENAFEMYTTAKQMSAKTLEDYCAKYIVTNISTITATETFKSMDPQISRDFLCDVAPSIGLRS